MIVCLSLAPMLGDDSATTRWGLGGDSRNEFFTLFRYTPVEGLGYEEGVGRRDPCAIIRVGDLYDV